VGTQHFGDASFDFEYDEDEITLAGAFTYAYGQSEHKTAPQHELEWG
jgi:hypothetical protein